MRPVLKWTIVALGIAAMLAALAFLSVYLASEAIIQRRYPLPSTTLPPVLAAKTVLHGRHLLAIAGCSDCHGAGLQGRLLGRNGKLLLYAGNLRFDTMRLSDGDFERIVRYGIKPDATSLWAMPSGSYTYMSENDVASIVSYLRKLGPVGAPRPQAKLDFAARMAILEGDLIPVAIEAEESPASLDLGPRYDGGRYLARVSCGECHNTDLSGSAAAPDLRIVAKYDRSAFFELLRGGRGAGGRNTPVMTRLARTRFREFADYEIMALYDYLDARLKAPRDLYARAAAERKRAESERASRNFPQ